MKTYAIVELEEGSLAVTVASREGHTTKVVRTVRLALTDLGRDGLANALRGLGSDLLQGTAGVHVVFGERRIQHFLSTVPKMAASEVVEFVQRESLRVTGMPSNEDVLTAPRLVRRLANNRLVIGVTAMARSVWEPIHEAFKQAGIAVLGVHSMEACLALAAPPEAGTSTAILECNAGRARFVLCDGQSPVQVRRFLIGGGEAHAEALVAQLAMELPRTIDWLRETGYGLPGVLVLGTRVGIPDESIEMIRGDLQKVVRATISLQLQKEHAAPGLGVAKLFERLFAGAPPPSLLATPQITLPWSASRLVGLGAAAAAGLACSWSAVIDVGSLVHVRQKLGQVTAESQLLRGQLAGLELGSEVASSSTGEDLRLQAALNLRRPISRLASEVSNCAGEMVHLEELKFASLERIVVTGVVQGESRKSALAALAEFSRQVRGLPYLLADGQEEVNEVVEQPNRFRFRLSLSWRNP